MAETKDYNKALNSLYEYLLGVLGLYKNLTPVLKRELESIQQDNIELLNESLKSQQALLLQTNSFENSVTNFLSELGISAKNLTEMIPLLPTENQLPFYALLGQFGQAVAEVNFYHQKCRVLLQSKLYRIDKVLSKQGIQKDNTTYDQDAAEVRRALFPKSFETVI